MYEFLHGDVDVFDFDDFANNLLEQGLQASPSEIHGCLTGLLAAGAEAEPEVGLDALTQTLDVVLHGELAGQVMQLYTVTSAALLDEEFNFHPLLPDDSADIGERTASLTHWCEGFLAGFAFIMAGTDKAGAALPGDSGEILKDFAAMTEATVDEQESEDESENSYIELIEYLRFATLNVFMDNRSRLERSDFTPEQGQPIH